jgi:hypothetical protein
MENGLNLNALARSRYSNQLPGNFEYLKSLPILEYPCNRYSALETLLLMSLFTFCSWFEQVYSLMWRFKSNKEQTNVAKNFNHKIYVYKHILQFCVIFCKYKNFQSKNWVMNDLWCTGELGCSHFLTFDLKIWSILEKKYFWCKAINFFPGLNYSI